MLLTAVHRTICLLGGLLLLSIPAVIAQDITKTLRLPQMSAIPTLWYTWYIWTHEHTHAEDGSIGRYHNQLGDIIFYWLIAHLITGFINRVAMRYVKW